MIIQAFSKKFISSDRVMILSSTTYMMESFGSPSSSSSTEMNMYPAVIIVKNSSISSIGERSLYMITVLEKDAINS